MSSRLSPKAAAVAAFFGAMGALAGCGGGGNDSPPRDAVPITSSLEPVEGQVVDATGQPISLPPSTEIRTVTLKVDGKIYPDAILAPSTVPIDASTSLMVLPEDVPILDGVFGDPDAPTRARLDTYIDGQPAPVFLLDPNSGGVDYKRRPVGFAPGKHTVEVMGPLAHGGVVNDGTSKAIRVNNSFKLNFEVNKLGFTTWPSRVTSLFPANGGSLNDSRLFFRATLGANNSGFLNPEYYGIPFRVEFIKSNGNVSKTVKVNGNGPDEPLWVEIEDLSAAGANATIPANGIDSVVITCQTPG
jgi:hypothetical protein